MFLLSVHLVPAASRTVAWSNGHDFKVYSTLNIFVGHPEYCKCTANASWRRAYPRKALRLLDSLYQRVTTHHITGVGVRLEFNPRYAAARSRQRYG